MKKLSILSLVLVLFSFGSCNSDDPEFEAVVIANAVLESKSIIRDRLSVEGPSSLLNSGKIYAYQDYIFVNDIDRGIHVIDSRNPENPTKIAFIQVLGNRDIEVRNNLLYADSFTDLVVFDISNIENITLINRYNDAFDGFGFGQAVQTEFADWQDYGNYDPREQFIVGWSYETRQIEIEDDIFLNDAVALGESSNNTGQGGSFARFKIVDNFLYAVDVSTLYTFELTGTDAIEKGKEQIGWNIETIFNQDDYLYIGSANGMLIYDISARASPIYQGGIMHWEGCDPVVVQGDYAYLTLRGGNACGQDLSFLQVINVSDKTNPIIIDTYDMQEPYGLGIKGDQLFVSDGSKGLKVYDNSDPETLEEIQIVDDIRVFDVIALQDRLLAIAGKKLYQFAYTEDGLEGLSVFEIN